MSSADCVIVGAGLAGAVAALRLNELGAEVVVIERGEAVTDPPGSHVRNDPPFRDDPDGYFAAIDTFFDYLDVDAPPAALPGAFTTEVHGGMGIVWTNNCPRAVPGVDRPGVLDDDQWERSYQTAERCLQVRSDQFDDSRRARLVQHRLSARLAHQGRAVEALPLAGHRESASHIHFVGPADVLAEAPEVRVRAGEVTRVEVVDRRARGVVVDGEMVAADHVVVAGGAIETPRLLARSGAESPALGRYLSFHPVVIGQVVLDDAENLAEPDPLPRLGIPPTADHPWFTQILRDTCPFDPTGDDRAVDDNRLVEIQVFCPVEPDPANRLDRNGDRPRFDVPLRADDRRRRAEILDDIEELCAEIGRWRQGAEPQWAALGTPHLMGSTRIGSDPHTSVVDVTGRVHGVEGLSVVGNSVIPGRLAVNPSLTAAALAVHAAESIVG